MKYVRTGETGEEYDMIEYNIPSSVPEVSMPLHHNYIRCKTSLGGGHNSLVATYQCFNIHCVRSTEQRTSDHRPHMYITIVHTEVLLTPNCLPRTGLCLPD